MLFDSQHATSLRHVCASISWAINLGISLCMFIMSENITFYLLVFHIFLNELVQLTVIFQKAL